jgi:hypothetical protein
MGISQYPHMTKYIELTQDQVAIVDDEDYEHLIKYNWRAGKFGNSGKWYAFRSLKVALSEGKSKLKTIYMHRQILGLIESEAECDHEDSNGLNNQRYNLRIANSLQNNQNVTKRNGCSSIYKGVDWFKPRNKWRAEIRAGDLESNNKHHKKIYLGIYADEIEAAKAYDRAAIKYHGKFAKTNFPIETYESDSEIYMHKKSSIYKGVSWTKGRWMASIAAGEVSNRRRKTIHIGYFEDEIEAAQAYDQVALKYFGESAKLNFSNKR